MAKYLATIQLLLLAQEAAVYAFRAPCCAASQHQLFSKHRGGCFDDSLELIEHAKHTNWDSYQHVMLDPLVVKRKGRTSRRWLPRLLSRGNKIVKAKAADESAKQRAIQYFREKQYEQHHHEIHAVDREHSEQSFPDSLKSHNHVDEIDDVEVRHRGGGAEKYLDKLSEPKHTTWEDYKVKVSKLNQENMPWKDLRGEVEELKQEVSTLQDLLQMEQSMYQASNRALHLAVDAQSSCVSTESTSCEGEKGDDTIEKQLKEFDEKANEYEKSLHSSKKQDERKRPNLFGLMW
mmetsp:Transcript_23124/g.48363  ORF Transcript_23124/g.48363 Transcript_23124/m.48363 type:complete len:291 (-) Transcript_23124:248-1120(-)